ncbi:all-trans-retinol 13,14-reductase-like [Lineus longissimus]|uniref:all-trans-retinol 13,14-reductase-like n=1 Tax=Lineus longissimus TaxID=88925 RepID=UPI002B4E5063
MIVNTVIEYLLANPSIIVAGIALYTLIVALSFFLSSPKPGPNPFAVDRRKPPKDVEFDQALRDKVLKQGFSMRKVPEDLDAVIIGSGIGSLATASLLSQVGRKVLVLEQHDQAGGCCHTFIEKGYEFDVGIHYIGQMFGETMTKILTDQVTGGQLVWEQLEDAFDIVALGDPAKARKYEYRSTKEGLRAGLLEAFPKEQEAIDKYLNMCKDIKLNSSMDAILKMLPMWIAKIVVKTGIYSLFSKCFHYQNITLKEAVDKITDNEDLKAVFSYNWGDYGTQPKKTTMAMHAAVQNHFLNGGFYPRGGASEIALNIIPIIERSGGRVFVRAPVSQILVNEQGKACGVRVTKSTGDFDIKAPIVISGAGVVNTFQYLLPKEIATKSAIYKLLQRNAVKSGMSMISVFAGLKGTTEELGLKKQNVWAFNSSDLDGEFDEFCAKTPEDAVKGDVPLMFLSFPSTKDSTWEQRHPGKSTVAIVTIVPWEWFKQWEVQQVKKRCEEYEDLKNGIGRQMWKQACLMYPQIEDKLDYFEVGSPLSNKYYIGSPKGEVYGLDHDKARFGSPEVAMTLRPDTDVPGLFLTGQDVLSCGFSGGLHGGLLCAGKVLNRNCFMDLVKFKKQLKQAKDKKQE